MAADETFIDPPSLDDFHRGLQTRLDEARAALAVLTTGPATEVPALGGFFDALKTATRHQVLRDEFVLRLRSLIDELVFARDATAAIAAQYRTAENLTKANIDDIGSTLRPVGEVFDGGQRHAR